MNIPIQLTVSVYNEFADDIPTHARIELNKNQIERIKKLSQVVKRHKVTYIAEWDCSPEFFVLDEAEEDPEIKPWDGSVECEMLVVRDTNFYWKGVIKHTDIRYETDIFSIKELDNLISFFKNEPINQLPRYLNEEEYSKREIALQRMKVESPSN